VDEREVNQIEVDRRIVVWAVGMSEPRAKDKEWSDAVVCCAALHGGRSTVPAQ
jgi:hypothetical protein